MNKTKKWILGAVLLTILAVYPTVFGIYYSNVFVTFAIFALFAVTLNLLLGYTGLLSFGHAMFFGTGGYGTAIALERIEGLPLLDFVPHRGEGQRHRFCHAAPGIRPAHVCSGPEIKRYHRW
jgi:branched-chain amino acid transport system permease protein